MKADKIYLIGFMAAGKSTVARALGRRLGWRAEDLDEIVEAREGRSIATIFAREGEAYFRALERQVLLDLLPLRDTVVATGGGTFVDAENRAAINRDGFSIWLDAPLDELVARMPTDGRRPLAADRSQLEQLYLARRFAYKDAHLRLDASNTRVEELVERILVELE